MKYVITVVFMYVGLSSCIQDRALSYNGLTVDPGYFIECYLVPDDIYKLSATKLQPLYDDYILDYSLSFDVEIDTLKLHQGVFKESNSDYIFNYAHNFRFKPESRDSVKLQVITPELDTVIAYTSIPEEIRILNEKKEGNVLSFDLVLSEVPQHNYFMVNVNALVSDSIYRKTRFLDYGRIDQRDTVNFIYTISNTLIYDSLEVIVKRMTQANYDYQISLENAKDANSDSLILPSSLAGNLNNATGIFTCYTQDRVVWKEKEK